MSTPASPRTRPWWSRPGLESVDGRIVIAGRDVEALAREHGTPLMAIDLERIAENATRLDAAFAATGSPYRIRYAMKAAPMPEVLGVLRRLGFVGIDACSPDEVELALASGWAPEEISFTGTNVSERDLDILLAHPIRLNLDAISQLRRVGRRAPGRDVGIRINPESAGVGFNDKTSYSGEKPTKFGIYPDRLEEAVQVAAEFGLRIVTVHFHAGSGWMADGLGAFDAAAASAAGMVRHLLQLGCPIEEVDVGGGIGVPGRAEDQMVDLADYAAAAVRHLAPLDVTVATEPGEFIADDAGIQIAEVVTVEQRRDVSFVGLDIGWNVNPGNFVYAYPQAIYPVVGADREPTTRVTIAGHINEASDLFAEDYPLAPVQEGDIVAILQAGAYTHSMSSRHCLRRHLDVLYLQRGE